MRIIAGALGGRNLKTVEGPGYRPATAKVREAIFSMLPRGALYGAVCAFWICLPEAEA